jgi:hypothetical protein
VSADDDFGDLIYVSQLKVERMHATLKLPPWRRLKSVEVKPPGAPGIRAEFDIDRDNLIAKLRAVTDAIYRKYAVRHYYDPLLRPGARFVGRERSMSSNQGKAILIAAWLRERPCTWGSGTTRSTRRLPASPRRNPQ